MIRELDYLEHILECTAVIKQCMREYDNPLKETIARDCILRNLQIAAQSAMRLPQEVQDRHPEIDWRGIRAFRNILVHEYIEISLEHVSNMLDRSLPDFEKMAQVELERLEQDQVE